MVAFSAFCWFVSVDHYSKPGPRVRKKTRPRSTRETYRCSPPERISPAFIRAEFCPSPSFSCHSFFELQSEEFEATQEVSWMKIEFFYSTLELQTVFKY